MKILLATGIYPPEIGGPATYAALVERELVRRGHSVFVLPFRAVRNYPSGIRHFVYFLKVAQRIFWADLILAQDTVSVGLPSVAVARLFAKPVVIRVPGDFAWEQGVQRFGVSEGIDQFQNKKYGFRVEILRFIQRRVVRWADAVITPSDYFLRLVRGWGVKDARSRTIYNGVSVPHAIVPKKFPHRTIISAGRLVPWKGFDILIKSIASIDADLLIAGRGEDMQRLEQLVVEHAVSRKVRFLGPLPREELLSYIAGADLFVLPSSFESFSFQLVEAMMLGMPVVALQAGNLSEIIKKGENGILVDKDKIDELPSILNGLLADESTRMLLGDRAREDSQKFSVEKTVDELESLFKTLV